MIITAYRTHEMNKVEYYVTNRIEVQSNPDIDPEQAQEEKELIKGGAIPLLSFSIWDEKEEKFSWINVPVQFIIAIEE